MLARAAPANKARLIARCEGAIARGIFGAPSFVLGEELCWGHDQLDEGAHVLPDLPPLG